jgi:hypothetical protein
LSRIIDLPIVSDEFNFIGYYGSEGGILASTNNGVYLLSDYKNGWEDYIDLWNDNQYLELGFFQEYYSQNGSEVLLIERNTEIFFSPLIFNTHSDTFISLNSKSLIPEELDFSNFDDDYTLNLIDNLKQEMQVYSLPNFKGLQSSTFSRSQDCGYYVEGEFALFGLKNSLYHKEFVTNPIIYSTKDSSVVKSFDGQYLTCMLSNNSMSRDVKLCTINSLGKLDLFNITQDSLIYSSEGFFDVLKSGFSDNGMELYLNRKSGILDVFDLSNLELKELSNSINSNFVISLKKVPKFNLISIAYPGEVHFLSTSSGDILWRMC